MFNLLPEALKNEIKKEYFIRKVLLSLVFVIFIQIIFLVFIFPTWLISNLKQADVVLRGEAMNRHLSSLNIASTTSDIKSLNAKLAVMDSSLRYPALIPFVNSILSQKTKSIVINNFVYTSKDDSNAGISLEGISSTREALTTFVKNLQATGLFKSVDLPISNFTKDKNLNFSINITISKQ